MDVFSDDALAAASNETTPSWLLAATAAAAPPATPTGDLARLPAEMIVGVLSWLPSDALAAACASARWLSDAVRAAAAEAVQRHGVRMPARRLGEGWPCVVKRAELRAASRKSGLLSVGFAAGAWVTTDGILHLIQLHRATSARTRPYLPWLPQPALPRPRAKAVACGSAHVLVLLDNSSVVLLETPPPTADALPGPTGGIAERRARPSGRQCEWKFVVSPEGISPNDATSPSTSRGSAHSGRAPAPPPAYERAVGVAAGAFHSFIVGERGGLWSFGSDACGQLGLGGSNTFPSSSSSSPLEHAEPLAVAMHHRALQPSGGGHHSLVLTHSGAVLAFGFNGSGQLGMGDQATRRTPTAVPIPAGEVACAVSAGGDHSLVLTERGDVYGFGSSAYGALGRPPAAEVVKLPVRVPLSVPIRQIAAGYDHALAVTYDGRVLSWGSAGELAYGMGALPPDEDTLGDPPDSPPRHESNSSSSDASRSASPGPREASHVGQLGRWVDPHGGREDAYMWAIPLLFSASPAIATAFGTCELVAAGSFASIGLGQRVAGGTEGGTEGGPKREAGGVRERGVHVLDAGDAYGSVVKLACSAPPRDEPEDVE